jgi:transketolase
MSAADLMAVLLAKYYRYDWANPHHPNNDRLVFSKGHACPVLYAMYKAAGAITDAELLTLRKLGSPLEGHPNPRACRWVDVATGSLGQGIGIAVGMGLNGKYLDKLPYRVWVVLGDSEMAEGSVWEAFDKAWYYKLDNITAILDMNRLGQRGPTELEWDSSTYAARIRSFGWHAIELNGHDLTAVDRAYAEATATTGRPTCLIAKTEKGHGVSLVANKDGWHGKALNAEQAKEAIRELGGERNLKMANPKPEDRKPAPPRPGEAIVLPTYRLGTKEATRKAYGDALAALGNSRSDVVALDGEVCNSTFSEEFKKLHPDRFFEMYIAEQQMVAAAVGLSVLGKRPFASTFAAFFARAYDHIRMAAVSNATLHLCGSHAGVSIGEDGPSQMGLEDLAMMRAVCGSTVLYPCDPNQTARLMGRLLGLTGITYLRTTREKTPVIYDPKEDFSFGGSKVLRQTADDRATVIAAGITLHEALRAYDTLQNQRIPVRVIDAYSVKPIDKDTLHKAARETGKLVVVEDHWIEGGLGDAVLEAFAVPGVTLPRITKLAVTRMPDSGSPTELLHAAGIDAEGIAQAVKSLL